MHITRFTDYALRVLMLVALKGEQLTTIQDIADHYQISKNHLMKVVQQLSQKGYLIAVRGSGGGVKLSRPPIEINIGKLFRDIETDLALVDCFADAKSCCITPACTLKRVLGRALRAFVSTLDEYTLEDLLAGQQQPLEALLSLAR